MRERETENRAPKPPKARRLPPWLLWRWADAAMYAHEFGRAYERYAILAAKTCRKENLHFCHSLWGMGNALLLENRDPERAMSLLRDALRSAEKQPPSRKSRLAVGRISLCMGEALLARRDYSQALCCYTRAKQSLEPCRANVLLAASCNGIAFALYMLGDKKQAVDAVNSALHYSGKAGALHTFASKVLAWPNVQTLASQNLAFMLGNSRDRLDTAMQLAYRTVTYREETLHDSDGTAYFGLVQLYRQLNDFEKALFYAQKALEACRQEKDMEHADTGRAYLYLAECWFGLDPKRHPEAKSSAKDCAQAACAILSSCKQPNNSPLAEACLLSSEIFLSQNLLDTAERYIRIGLESAKLTASSDHPLVLSLYGMLSELHSRRGHCRAALAYAEHIAARKRAEGGSDPCGFLGALYRAALLAERNGDRRKSLDYAREMMGALAEAPGAILRIPQERLRLSYLRRMRTWIGQCYSAAFASESGVSPLSLYAFTLRSHNVDAEIQYLYARHGRAKASPALRAAYEAYAALERQCQNLQAEGEADGAAFPELAWRLELAQVRLIRQWEEEPFENPFSRVSAESVQSALRKGEALIEFVCYEEWRWSADDSGPVLRKGDKYCAFLVLKEGIQAADLGDAPAIDTLVEGLCSQITTFGACEELLEKAYAILMAPFAQGLAGVERLYLVPDSNLYRLPFELLRTPEGIPLFERCSTAYLSSGRELLREHKRPSPEPSIAILADPLFELEDPRDCSEPSRQPEDSNPLRSLGENASFRASKIEPLPFTGIEADEIAGLFPNRAVVRKGAAATKYAIPTNGSAEYLHIATHGFAFPEEDRETDGRSPSIRSAERGEQCRRASSPMQRCGLLFAGAKTWWQGSNLPEEYGNGVLTGSDIAGMDLSQYRMLVLSACETGLGEMRSGEGMKGLRHAFALAGVSSLICTLWSVDDLAAFVLMDRFYEELMRDKLHNIPAALRKAQRFLREAGAAELYSFLLQKGLEEAALEEFEAMGYFHAEHPFAHPYFWAGFIYQGSLNLPGPPSA